jgi:hypothetical protein
MLNLEHPKMKKRLQHLSENQIVNLAGMFFLIPRLGIQHSNFLIRLAGLFMTPLSGIILIGACALLFMPVIHTCGPTGLITAISTDQHYIQHYSSMVWY